MFKYAYFKTTPTPYGWFHILSVTIILLVTRIFAKYGKATKEKNIDRVVFSFGIFLLLIELYKQILVTVEAGSYVWSNFPFQFCSVPVYVCLLAPLLKNKTIKKGFYSFLEIYSLAAAIVVLIYPVSVFSKTVNLSVHTMLWHGAMLVVSIYIINATEHKDLLASYLKATAIWIGFIILALAMNIFAYNMFFKGTEHVFNMFMISPYYVNEIPICLAIYNKFGYSGYLRAYIYAFGIAGLLVYFFIKRFSRRKAMRAQTSEIISVYDI